MIDVLIALAPVLIAAGWVFGWYVFKQVGICVASCLAAEVIFTAMRRRRSSVIIVVIAAMWIGAALHFSWYPAAIVLAAALAVAALCFNARTGGVPVCDGSAAVTGVILALSLPAVASWHVGVVGSFAAIAIGKIVFGGLGQNIFNPAMVGRAFVMIAFPVAMAAGGYRIIGDGAWVDTVTAATPMIDAFKAGKGFDLGALFIGKTNGSLGETSALACLIGGIFLCLRRTVSWQIPLGMIAAVGAIGIVANVANPSSEWTALHHLAGGAVMFGAFFIATDPVTSPLTSSGKLIFGLGVGALVMIMRLFSAWPEGVMFSVLLMNAVVPLINRWTIPKPLGGAPKTVQ